MTLAAAQATEPEELQEQQRGAVQISQARDLTMNGHLRSKLKLGRRRLEKTWLDAKQLSDDPSAEIDDEMQLLARDIDMSTHNYPAPVVNAPAEVKPDTPTAPSPAVTAPTVITPVETKPTVSKLPLLAALALGLGIPATAGVFMAPAIISAMHGPAVVETHPEYQPILLPGKPNGAPQ